MKRINLKKFPKITLLESPSSINYLQQLSKIVGVDVYIKRDDLSSIGFGGNKLRKLEYLLGEAHKQNATHILTIGATQSNHARLTAVAATKYGFKTELFLKRSVENDSENYQMNGNIVLNNIIESAIHRIESDEFALGKVQKRMEEIKKEGGKPYFIPTGGSNALGTLGYLDGFLEILQQEKDLNLHFNHIAVATGSGGTHAGLLVGKNITDSPIQIKAYNVQPEKTELEQHTATICEEALNMIGQHKLNKIEVNIDSSYAGKSYGIPEKYHVDSIKFLAKYEGIFLDPVYTAKAFSGLLMDIESGYYKKGEKVLFIHTGGSPGIFAYADFF